MDIQTKTVGLISLYEIRNKEVCSILNISKSTASKKISQFHDRYFTESEYKQILMHIYLRECSKLNNK